MPVLMQRVLSSLRHRGLVASATLGINKARRVRGHSALSIWYELALQDDRPRRALAEGFELNAARPEDVGLLAQLPIDPAVARLDAARAHRRLDEGATLWLVTKGDRLAFACWTYRDEMPVWAARGGALVLPPDVVCLEDSMSSPAFRGQGVAPAAWAAIADRLADEGRRAMVTKVGAENTPSRRAVEKTGFHEIAHMRHGRRGWNKQLRVRLPADSSHEWLRAMETD